MSGETALQWAVSANDAAMAELLIDLGAPVDWLQDDMRPLAQALFYGCREAAELLVRRQATLTLERGVTPLDIARGGNHPEIVQTLLKFAEQ